MKDFLNETNCLGTLETKQAESDNIDCKYIPFVPKLVLFTDSFVNVIKTSING